MARAAVPIFSPSCGLTRTTTGRVLGGEALRLVGSCHGVGLSDSIAANASRQADCVRKVTSLIWQSRDGTRRLTSKTTDDRFPPRRSRPIRANMAKVFEQAAQIARTLRRDAARSANREVEAQVTPVEQVVKTLGAVAQSYMPGSAEAHGSPDAAVGELQPALAERLGRRLGEDVEPVAAPERGDRRFNDKDWQENTVFDFLKQFYLISARWAGDLVKNAEGLDDHTRHKARFYVEQIANALSPSNFALTNPEVLRATLATNGANLIEGLKNLEEDSKTRDGRLRIKQTDVSAFEIGKNIAMTPGQGRVPERYLSAHPICAGDREGLRDSAR